MCSFSQPVEKVSGTNIFARAYGGKQLLVYSMAYAAKSELAMVLPIPVPPNSPEEAVRFINLEKCPDFFVELSEGFPDAAIYQMGASLEAMSRTLKVHEVGAYEASFVPRPEEFGRLDDRFRLPAEIWLELNNYQDWGFAVFKLKRTELTPVHPMAFEFPRRDRSRLFFPTLHVHNRRFERRAFFDHTLYCQPEPAMNWHMHEWEESDGAAAEFVHCAEAASLLDLGYPCWRTVVKGMRKNRDTWLGKGEIVPEWS